MKYLWCITGYKIYEDYHTVKIPSAFYKYKLEYVETKWISTHWQGMPIMIESKKYLEVE